MTTEQAFEMILNAIPGYTERLYLGTELQKAISMISWLINTMEGEQ